MLLPVLRRFHLVLLACSITVASLGCDAGGSGPAAGAAEAPLVDPPFAIGPGAADLLFTYFDAEGPHTVGRLEDVPEAHREAVAVRSLSLAPDARPAAGQVFVADLRAPGSNGRYAVRLVPREDFDRRVDEAAGRGAAPAVPAASGEVVIYGASWCGACRSAAAFLRSEGVAFQEKD